MVWEAVDCVEFATVNTKLAVLSQPAALTKFGTAQLPANGILVPFQ